MSSAAPKALGLYTPLLPPDTKFIHAVWQPPISQRIETGLLPNSTSRDILTGWILSSFKASTLFKARKSNWVSLKDNQHIQVRSMKFLLGEKNHLGLVPLWQLFLLLPQCLRGSQGKLALPSAAHFPRPLLWYSASCQSWGTCSQKFKSHQK